MDALFHQVAFFAAFLIGLAGLLGRVESRRRHRMIESAATLDAIKSLSWAKFEELCAETYRRKGFAVALTPVGADDGVDLILQRGNERIFVQCKRYTTRLVDVRPVRELYGVMAQGKASGAIFITSGRYTSAAAALADDRLTLIDGEGLVALLGPVAQRVS